MTKKTFEELLLQTIDDSLSTLGDSAKQAIYFHLENQFRIAKKDIPYHVANFEDGLEKIFGAGAQFLEIIIMKKLFEKIGHPLEWSENKDLVFVDYVMAAKRSFSNKKQ